MGALELGLVLDNSGKKLKGRRQRRGEVVPSFVTTSPALWVVGVGGGLLNQRGVEIAEGHSHPAAGRTLEELAGRLPEGWTLQTHSGEVTAVAPSGERHIVFRTHPQAVAVLAIDNARALRQQRSASTSGTPGVTNPAQ